MPPPAELTERLLMEAGGWKEMKEAKALHAGGGVEEARYADGQLEGLVRFAGGPRKVRVRILSPTHWENLCTCPLARRDGAVCAHALALALQVMRPVSPPAQQASAAPQAPDQAARPRLGPGWPAFTEDPSDPAAEPARLHVVLAPNLAAAWEKGRLLAGIELALGESSPCLLPAAKPGAALFLGPRDAALWHALQELSPEQPPGMMQLGRADFLRLLESLAGHPRVTLGKRSPARVAVAPARLPLKLERGRLRVDWPGAASPLLHPSSGAAWLLEGEVFRAVAPGLPPALREILTPRGLALSPEGLDRTLEHLESAFSLPDDLRALLPVAISPAVELELEGSLNHLEARLWFRYGDKPRRAAGQPAEGFLSGPGSPGEDGPWLAADAAGEAGAAAALARWGFAGPGQGGLFVLKDKAAILRFFAHGYPRLDPGWRVTLGQRFAHAAAQVEPVQAGLAFTRSGENWFALETSFATASGARFTREEIQRLLVKGQHSRPGPGGKIAVLDPDLLEELDQAIADCAATQEKPGLFRVDARHAGFLEQTAAETGLGVSGDPPWSAGGPAEDTADESCLPADLRDILRPYQRQGALWMLSLARRGLGGVLADDMGLGKTIQTLAFLRALGGEGPALVACPASLVHNWMAEAARFAPGLNAVALQGPDRVQALADHPDAGLYVTSHALLRIDADLWRERELSAVIVDEAQHIKNPDSAVARAAHALRARHRFALTGTPVENSVRDLWSILQFAAPGYLGPRREFAERFEKPIASGGGAAERRRLARRLRPVILRRLKSEVARELPEKIEQTVWCDLTPEQRAIYGQILEESRRSIHEAEGGRQRMLALTALLRLRQACCDLRLLGLPGLEAESAAVKLGAVEELVAEAVEGGHRVLVFSQFVEMLRVLVPALAERGWRHAYLDGQTRNRAEAVRRFQEDEGIPVFLISLKAGGTGLNLTGADTVIHVDPWWNPAVEAQATDRAHRIGQTRVVTSYKLIVRDTVEEKILALQEKKKAAARSLLDPGNDGGDAGLTEEEILGLIG